MLIRKVDQYIGGKGERVEALVLIESETGEAVTAEVAAEQSIEEPLTVFAGVATIMSGIPGPGGQLLAHIPNELRFPIKAENAAEAISAYPEELDRFINELKRQQEEAVKEAAQELYVPNAAESEAINNLKIAGSDD